MIEITSSTAFTFYLIMTLGVIFGMMLYSHFKKKGDMLLPQEKQLVICEYCSYAYLSDRDCKVTQCPQCRSFNKNESH